MREEIIKAAEPRAENGEVSCAAAHDCSTAARSSAQPSAEGPPVGSGGAVMRAT